MSTPDGENCGLLKNLAVTAIVSSRVVQPLIESFISSGMSKLNDILSGIDIRDTQSKEVSVHADFLGWSKMY